MLAHCRARLLVVQVMQGWEAPPPAFDYLIRRRVSVWGDSDRRHLRRLQPVRAAMSRLRQLPALRRGLLGLPHPFSRLAGQNHRPAMMFLLEAALA